MKIGRDDKRIIEYYFIHYRLFKTSLSDDKRKITIRKGNGRTGRQTEITDTDCKWMEVIDRALKKFESTPKQKLIYKRFFLREKEVKIFTDMYIDRSTYYLWQHEVYEYAYVVAVSKQLLAVE